MQNWIIYIWIAIVFFVMGQICLKYDKLDALTSCCYFTIAMGMVGLLTLGYKYIKERKREGPSMYAIIAGILFFFGNMLWIFSIKSAPSLSLIRIMMAGGETLLLLFASYIVFKEKIISLVNAVGIALILAGVYLIS
jgi:multidrug transporter EmrE-like cation transporter